MEYIMSIKHLDLLIKINSFNENLNKSCEASNVKKLEEISQELQEIDLPDKIILFEKDQIKTSLLIESFSLPLSEDTMTKIINKSSDFLSKNSFEFNPIMACMRLYTYSQNKTRAQCLKILELMLSKINTQASKNIIDIKSITSNYFNNKEILDVIFKYGIAGPEIFEMLAKAYILNIIYKIDNCVYVFEHLLKHHDQKTYDQITKIIDSLSVLKVETRHKDIKNIADDYISKARLVPSLQDMCKTKICTKLSLSGIHKFISSYPYSISPEIAPHKNPNKH